MKMSHSVTAAPTDEPVYDVGNASGSPVYDLGSQETPNNKDGGYIQVAPSGAVATKLIYDGSTAPRPARKCSTTVLADAAADETYDNQLMGGEIADSADLETETLYDTLSGASAEDVVLTPDKSSLRLKSVNRSNPLYAAVASKAQVSCLRFVDEAIEFLLNLGRD